MAAALVPRLGKPKPRERNPEMTKQAEITITAEQIEKLIAMAEKQEQKAAEYYEKGHDQAATRRDGISLGIYQALKTIGVEIDS